MATDQSSSETITHIIDKVSDGLGYVASQLSSHAPEAWALAVKGTYANAVATLAVGGLWFVLASIALLASIFFIKAANKTDGNPGAQRVERDTDFSFSVAFAIMGMLSGAGCIIFLLISLANISDSHAWAAVIAPDAITASDLLRAAIK